jgi:hypothetical protein
MELLFMDESGDNGFAEGGTEFYILAGISIEARHWKEYFWRILDFRRQISQKYGLKIDELKGSDLFSHRGPFFNSPLGPYDLEWIYEQVIKLICDSLVELFVVAKSKDEFRRPQPGMKIEHLARVFNERIWIEYLSMYEQYLIEKSGRRQYPQTALIYFDFNPGQEKPVRKMVREFSRKFDQQSPYPAAGIVEDVVFRDSKGSYFVQLADVLAFSMNRIITRRGQHDVFSIKPKIVEGLKSKVQLRRT